MIPLNTHIHTDTHVYVHTHAYIHIYIIYKVMINSREKNKIEKEV